MNINFKTNRLYLREFNIQDAIHLYKMNNDPDVIKYTGDLAFNSLEDAEKLLLDYDYKAFNMGRWAVCLKENDTFLGWCGLKYHPNEKLVEVGYRFYKTHWNKGYATESAKASITYGFETLKLREIYAHAHIDNLPSHSVIEKCGLHFINEAIYDGMPAKLYKIESPFYSIKHISAHETYIVRQPVLREGRPIEDQYQLRGMAILKEFQHKGLGKLLVIEGEKILLQKKAERLWFNAREIAISFYKNNNYHIHGNAFNIPQVGIHYIMSKKLI